MAVPAACELNAPADGLQRSADAGNVPWRLDPTHVALECLRRGLGAATWRISRTGEYAVVFEPRSRLIARVRLEQPARHGPGGIWGVTDVEANKEPAGAAACRVPSSSTNSARATPATRSRWPRPVGWFFVVSAASTAPTARGH